MSIFNVKDFGASGNGVEDDFPAFRVALDTIDAVNSRDTSRGAILFIPSGTYRLIGTLNIARNMVLQGTGQSSSRLVFVKDPNLPANASSPGIAVIREKHADGRTTLGDWTIIRELSVRTPNSFSPNANLPSAPIDDDDTLDDGTNSGIVLYTKATVENCEVGGFEHDGIHINTSAPGSARNANNWHIRNCFVHVNGRHGLFVSGGDANAGCAINLLCQENCRWGIFDRSFLGNTYVGCTAESNGHRNEGPSDPRPSFGGPYRTIDPAARHVFLGCYSEQDQSISLFRYPSLVIGGFHSAGLTLDPASRRHPVIIPNEGNPVEVDHLRIHGTIATDITEMASIASGAPQDIDPREEPSSVIFAKANGLRLQLNLPSPANPEAIGRQYTVKKVDASPEPVVISVAAGTTERIDGQSTLELNKTFSWVVLIPDGANWNIIGRG
jgi:hypothetical protein